LKLSNIKMMDIVRYKLPNFLDSRQIFRLSLTNKANFEALKEKVQEQRRWEKICKIFPKDIIDIVGKQRFLKGEHVEWQQRWLGRTDYIDRIFPKDLDNNLSYGIDCYDRFFIFIKIRKVNYSRDSYELLSDKNTILTFFKRYTDFSTVVTNDNSGENPLIDSHRCIGEEGASLLKKFLQTGIFVRPKSERVGRSEIFLL
jgi:hypothetical protein